MRPFSCLSLSLSALLALHSASTDCPAAIEVKESPEGAVVTVDGQLFAQYNLHEANMPYLWPIIGPTGKSMTREYPMKDVEGEKQDHIHHRGLWFGHENIGGHDTWAEEGTFKKPGKDGKISERSLERIKHLGKIQFREFARLEGGDTGIIVAVSDYISPDGKKLVEEHRTMTFSVSAETRTIDVDLELVASHGDVEIGDRKDAGLSIRVPHSMSVDAGEGGRVINSEGQTDKEAWGKRATWCDFNGPVEGETLGIAMLNHPSSFRHPTPWHARTYGLFTANAFGLSGLELQEEEATFVLKAGDSVKLHHRFIFHKGDEKAAKIGELFKTYASEPRS
jgi:hypothetical protein